MPLTSLLVINPNSSQSITDGLRDSLDPITPPGTRLSYFTAPPHAPAAISDVITANQTATACYEVLVESKAVVAYDGFLVSCCASFLSLSADIRFLTEVLPWNQSQTIH